MVESSRAAYQQALSARGYGPITTEVRAAADFPYPGQLFYYGEDYHQQACGTCP